jgi:predicted AAA+ superfamily ATPase
MDYSPFYRVPRYLENPVRKALPKKLVLVVGPRQVGKTTFALGFLGKDAEDQPSSSKEKSARTPARSRLLHRV